MRRKIIIIGLMTMLFAFPTQKARPQMVVSDPAHTVATVLGWIEEAASWVTQMTQMIEDLNLKKALQSIEQINQLNSLLELVQLVDDVACLATDFQFYMNISSNYKCLKFLNFKVASVNLKLSTDIFTKIISVNSFFSMNSEGRLNFIQQAKEALQQSAETMKAYNEEARAAVIQQAVKDYNRSTYFSGKFAAFNRYSEI
ncbi:MAG: hypothetical protein LBJ72_01595 [Dysgonamonadaceae bacterium]|jgi:hypothetical protein|nr:hypothetical protein [Dysgonamonadaceae bacterium]